MALKSTMRKGYMIARDVLRSRENLSFSTVSTQQLGERYTHLKHLINENFSTKFQIEKDHVFAINETDFSKIKVLGFDFDYTLAEYSDKMQEFIFRKATDILCSKHHFPNELRQCEYTPGFFIRGLHYDIQRSLMMKIDERHIVQPDTIFRGLRKLGPEEVAKELGETRHVPKAIMDESCFRGSRHLQQLTDIFSIPEMMLLACVVEYFTSRKIDYDHYMVFKRVQEAVSRVHIGGHLYKEIEQNVDDYLEKDCLVPLIDHLHKIGKTLFLLTNSGFPCVDVSLRHMIGDQWQDAFDIVIVEANKPEFFQSETTPFRRKMKICDRNRHVGESLSWDRIKEFKRGEVYSEGCCRDMMQLTKWSNEEVMYFGDQIYADLQNPSNSNGWYTAAVIPEVEHEIEVMNSEEFAKSVIWVQALEQLIDRMQIHEDAESRQQVHTMLQERIEVKKVLKEVYNERFGSIFRSQLQGTYFSTRLCRVADIYTSSVKNLIQYKGDHIFFPLRGTLPHEQLVSLAYQYDGVDEALMKTLEQTEPGFR